MRSLIIPTVLLAGCVGTGSLPAVQYYVLGNGPESVSARPVSQRSSLLLVSPTCGGT
jgi:uncharacterized lipoprotein YmbA